MLNIRGTLDLGILYQAKQDDLVAYSDADYAGDIPSYKSTTEQLITYGGSPIAWKSKIQGIVVTSSTESEYVALTSAIKKTLCIKELGVVSQEEKRRETAMYRFQKTKRRDEESRLSSAQHR
jgi:hypothetical protein